eukprot:g80071.t1
MGANSSARPDQPRDITVPSLEDPLHQDFGRLVNSRQLADVIFLVGADKLAFYGHKILLAARSKVFESMFFSGFCEARAQCVEIAVPDVHPRAFGVLLQHLYTDTETLSYDVVLYVLYAAKKYQVGSLVEACFSFMERKLTAENACIILESAPYLLDTWTYAMEFIEKNASEVLGSEAFLRLSAPSLKRLVQSDNLGVSEIQIWESCLQWARKECTRRGLKLSPPNLRLVLVPVLQHIRFPVMSIEQIVSDVSPKKILTNEELLYIFIRVGKGKGEVPVLSLADPLPPRLPPAPHTATLHDGDGSSELGPVFSSAPTKTSASSSSSSAAAEGKTRERKVSNRAGAEGSESKHKETKHQVVGVAASGSASSQHGMGQHALELLPIGNEKQPIHFDFNVRTHHSDEWCLDPSSKSANVRLDRNNSVCSLELGKPQHGFVTGTKSFSRGKHAWRVEIQSGRTGWVYIGICAAARRKALVATSFADPTSYGFSSHNQRYCAGIPRRHKYKKPTLPIDCVAARVQRVLAGLVQRVLAGLVQRVLAGLVQRVLAGLVQRVLAGLVQRVCWPAASGRERSLGLATGSECCAWRCIRTVAHVRGEGCRIEVLLDMCSISVGEGYRIDVLLDLEERTLKFANLNNYNSWVIADLPPDTRWVPHFNLHFLGKLSVQVIQLSEWAVGHTDLRVSVPI